jgi:Tissue inhibitor of metalloproteinase
MNRRHFKIICVLIAALIGVLVGNAAPAEACSCAASSVEEQFSRADVVFEGTVSVGPIEETVQVDMTPVVVNRYDFAVTARWKGAPPEVVSIYSNAPGGGNCGIGYPQGTSYLVFANRDLSTGLLADNICSGTTPRDQADAKVAVLAAMPKSSGGCSFGHRRPSGAGALGFLVGLVWVLFTKRGRWFNHTLQADDRLPRFARAAARR